MTGGWARPAAIAGTVATLLSLNALEFGARRRAFDRKFPDTPADAVTARLARHQAREALSREQLLHMIHTMLAAILAALLWRGGTRQA